MGMLVIFMGVDITARVVSFGETEDVKEVLLAKATLTSSEYLLTLRNDDGVFSPYTDNSMVRGRSYYGKNLTVTWDGFSIFDGPVRNMIPDPEAKTVEVTAQSKLSDAATMNVSGTATGVNAVEAAMGLIVAAGLGDLVDVASFTQAAGPAKAAGATVDYSFDHESNTTVLAMLNLVSDLASVSFFERNGLITARAFQPYQGNEAGLRFVIDTSNGRSWGTLEGQPTNYFNTATCIYTLLPENGTYTETDQTSLNLFGSRKKVGRTLGTDQLLAHDLASAKFFTAQFLARSSTPRTVLPIACGPEFLSTKLGERHPITYARFGFVRRPFEVIRIGRIRDKREIQLYLASLSML